MSTQHIDEADELATMVCVMSHGKAVVEDTPAEIKRQFGVGYSLIIESTQESKQLDA
jgi:ABC-type multidrug transport system ATPase subunit